MQHYLKETGAKIAFKAHSNGALVISALYKKYEEKFRHSVYALAFTGASTSCMPVEEYTRKVCISTCMALVHHNI